MGSPALNTLHKENFTAVLQRFQKGILINLAINRHGHVFKSYGHTRITIFQFNQQYTIVLGNNVELPLALAQIKQGIRNSDSGQPIDQLLLSSAATMRGGDSGSSLIRTPVA